MLKPNIIESKTFDFAIRVVNLYKYLTARGKEHVMTRQLLRCGTSIGANVAEAQRGQTKADFNAKMCIALKEAYETHYWIKLLYRTHYLTEREFLSLDKDLKDILAILTSICSKTNQ